MEFFRLNPLWRNIWARLALGTVAVIEGLFLFLRFKTQIPFPDFHHPMWLFVLCALLVVLGLALFRLSWSFSVLLMAAFVPFDLDASRPHTLPVSPIDYICLVVLVIALLRLRTSLWQKLREAFGDISFFTWTLFLAYSAVCVILMEGNIRNSVRWLEFLIVFFITLLIPAADKTKARLQFSKLLAVLGSVCSVWALFQYFRSDFDFMHACGPFGQHNVLSAFLSLCFPASLWLSLSNGRYKIFVLQSVIIFAGLSAAFSRGAIVGLLIAALCTALWVSKAAGRPRVALYGLGALFGFVSLLAAFHRLLWFNGRRTYLAVGLHILRLHPLFGLGPGNYTRKIQSYLSGNSLDVFQRELVNKHHIDFWQHLHNLYLQIAVEYGLLGFSLWMVGWFLLVWPLFLGLKQRRDAAQNLRFCFSVSVLAYLLHNTVDILFVNNLETIFAVILALYYVPNGNNVA